jgi:hypothetical protein
VVSPFNVAKKIAMMFLMLLNLGLVVYLVGSVTFYVFKSDKKTCENHNSLEILHQYGHMYSFGPPLILKLDQLLRLEFRNQEIADKQALQNSPSHTWREILRWLYKHHLVKTKLTKEVHPMFVDAFLVACKVGICLPNAEICKLDSVSLDLFLLMGEIAKASLAQTNSTGLLVARARQTTSRRSWKRGIVLAPLSSFLNPRRPSR